MLAEENIKVFAEHAHKNATWVIVAGALLVLFGIGALIYMGIANLAAVYCFGILMVIGGVFEIITAFQLHNGGRAWLWALCGLLYLAAGFLVFSNPFAASVILTMFLAAILLISGVIRIIYGFQVKPVRGWGWEVFSGALNMVLGLLILSTPGSAFWIIGMFLGIDMIFQGWGLIALGSAVRIIKK